MIPALAYVVIALAGVAVVWGVVTAIADKPPGKAQLLYAAGVWLVTLAQSIIAAVQLVAGFRPESPATMVGYLIGIVLLIPVAWFWANVERTRYSGRGAGGCGAGGAGDDAAAADAVDPGGVTESTRGSAPRTNTGAGRALVAVYGLFALAATARASVQLATRFDEAPLAYLLSAVAGVIYIVATVTLARGQPDLPPGRLGGHRARAGRRADRRHA